MMFETEQQLAEYTGYSNNTVNYLWKGLVKEVYTDDELIESINQFIGGNKNVK